MLQSLKPPLFGMSLCHFDTATLVKASIGALNIISPIPFSGFFASKYLRGRMLLKEAVRVASQRVAHANKLLAQMNDAGYIVPHPKKAY